MKFRQSFSDESAAALSNVRLMKKVLAASFEKSDPRIAEELKFFRGIATKLRNSRLGLEAISADLTYDEEIRAEATKNARILLIAEDELESELVGWEN